LKRLDSRFHGNDGKGPIPTFYEIIQIGTPKAGRGDSRYLPYAFTQQGVARLSGILTSPRAIKVNIAIIRGPKSSTRGLKKVFAVRAYHLQTKK
jgi:hypothetical protein